VYSFNLRQIGRRTEGQMGIEGRREKMRSGEWLIGKGMRVSMEQKMGMRNIVERIEQKRKEEYSIIYNNSICIIINT